MLSGVFTPSDVWSGAPVSVLPAVALHCDFYWKLLAMPLGRIFLLAPSVCFAICGWEVKMELPDVVSVWLVTSHMRTMPPDRQMTALAFQSCVARIGLILPLFVCPTMGWLSWNSSSGPSPVLCTNCACRVVPMFFYSPVGWKLLLCNWVVPSVSDWSHMRQTFGCMQTTFIRDCQRRLSVASACGKSWHQ